MAHENLSIKYGTSKNEIEEADCTLMKSAVKICDVKVMLAITDFSRMEDDRQLQKACM